MVAYTYSDGRRLSLSQTGSYYGDTWYEGDDFVIMKGITGLDLPPVELIDSESAGLDGSTARELKIKPRDVFFPIKIGMGQRSRWQDVSSFHGEFVQKLERFLAMLMPQPKTAGPDVRLTASWPWSSRVLDLKYVGGAEGEWSTETDGTLWRSYGLKFRALDPWWREEWERGWQIGSHVDLNPVPFCSTTEPWPRVISTGAWTNSGGSVNAGASEVPVYPTFRIRGPAHLLIVRVGSYGSLPNGDFGMLPECSFVIRDVYEDEYLTLNTDPRVERTLVDQDGNDLYHRLIRESPDRLPNGDQQVWRTKLGVLSPQYLNAQVNALGTNPNFEVLCFFTPGFRQPWHYENYIIS